MLGLEVSRLARNNADWHRLLELCAGAGTLILDEDGLSKARRGELAVPLPVGFVYDPAGKFALDPDAGVQQAVRHLFASFARTGSARAVVKAFAAEGLRFPLRIRTGARKGELAWTPLLHWRVLRVLHNPRYAGAFFFGRHRCRPAPGRQDERGRAAARAVDRAHP